MLATFLGSSIPRIVIIKDMANSSLTERPLAGVHSIQVGLSWMDPLVTFLKQGLLPEDKGVGRLHIIGYLKNKNCTSALTQGRIYCVCILK